MLESLDIPLVAEVKQVELLNRPGIRLVNNSYIIRYWAPLSQLSEVAGLSQFLDNFMDSVPRRIPQ